MKSSVPKVSVTMPVFNAGRYLTEAVRGVLTQTMANFELIIIDDGSTDGSAETLRKLVPEDSRIRLVCRENRGAVPSRNEAIALARGEYIAVNDADDVSHPERFERQLEFLEAHPDCIAVGARAQMFDPEGVFVSEGFKLLSPEEIEYDLLTRGANPLAHSAVMMRSDAVRTAGGYAPDYPTSHDMELWLRLVEQGKIVNLPEVLVRIRLHEGSLTHTQTQQQAQLAARAVAGARARRGMPPLDHSDPHRLLAPSRCRWVRSAIADGNVVGARRLAIKAIWGHPGSNEAWRGAVVAALGSRAGDVARLLHFFGVRPQR